MSRWRFWLPDRELILILAIGILVGVVTWFATTHAPPKYVPYMPGFPLPSPTHPIQTEPGGHG